MSGFSKSSGFCYRRVLESLSYLDLLLSLHLVEMMWALCLRVACRQFIWLLLAWRSRTMKRASVGEMAHVSQRLTHLRVNRRLQGHLDL